MMRAAVTTASFRITRTQCIVSILFLFLECLFSAHAFVQQSRLPVTAAPITITSTSLKGIKGFRAWFESQFPDAIQAMPRQGAHEEFDHVLIDLNQVIHISLRRSRSEGHALTIMMKELDACCALATPKMSLVLAMDGPPSAAKLATQRRRRFSTFVRSEWKQEQLSRFRKAFSKQDEAKRRRRYATETKTLCITPGTAFMQKAENALLYWAWQRMQNPNNILSKVQIFISSSNVHGEGEVKLLDWILQRNRFAQSIAILGGDSDLVLEGLVIPPSSSHNVFVLLPDGNKKYFSVSLWETTRALVKFLPKLNGADIMRVRTDMVLLLILNGNDYLPKLRGSSGFNRVFHTYLRLLHKWLDDKDAHPQEPFLVEPDSLEFNLPFCVAFFRQLAHLAPSKYLDGTYSQQPVRMSKATPLGQLNDLVDSEFIPQPMKWTLVSSDDDDAEVLPMNYQAELSNDALDESDEENGGEQVLMRLTIGKRETDEFYEYELWHDVSSQIKKTKHRLALMALDDLMGTDYFNEEDDGDDVDEEEEATYPGITSSGYSWEVQYSAPGRVDTYLAGLLWNLQSYQDGVCSDYSYNYGRRMSPTAIEIVDYLKEAMKENRTVGRHELLGDDFVEAVSAGISCLAALPSQMQDLIPEPYSMLSNTTVEDIYASCMDPEDNRFDLKQFEQLCKERIREVMSDGQQVDSIDGVQIEQHGRHGRRILTGDHYWLVLSRQKSPLTHPFDPPAPFSDRLAELRPNRRMKVSRKMATAEPRPRSVWSTNSTQKSSHSGNDELIHIVNHEAREVKHADIGDLLKTKEGNEISILDVDYMQAFPEFKNRKKKKQKRKVQFDISPLPVKNTSAKINGAAVVPFKSKNGKSKVVLRRDFDVLDRMKEYNIDVPPADIPTNTEGFTPLLLLNQLSDAKMIGDVDLTFTSPSTSPYAAVDPHNHELVTLVVKKGPKDNKKAILFEDLSYEQDRDINHVSRQRLKHHLSSLALCDIIGPRKQWTKMSFAQMKDYLVQQKNQNKSTKEVK